MGFFGVSDGRSGRVRHAPILGLPGPGLIGAGGVDIGGDTGGPVYDRINPVDMICDGDLGQVGENGIGSG